MLYFTVAKNTNDLIRDIWDVQTIFELSKREIQFFKIELKNRTYDFKNGGNLNVEMIIRVINYKAGCGIHDQH